MPGFASFIAPEPVLQALQPLRRLIHRTTQASRAIPGGRLYLGDGQPIIVFPAFGGGPQTTATLRGALSGAGFAAYDWGLGADKEPQAFSLNRCLRQLEEQVIEVFEEARQPVTLLGWGLSGIYARELAKRITPLVRQVITLGTPFNINAEGARHCALLAPLHGPEGHVDAALSFRLRQRPPVPCTSIYSLSDETVPWQMCVETESAESENIKLAVPYRQLVQSPKVLEIITHRLAQPMDEWRPFDA
jgi:hypothetical protein